MLARALGLSHVSCFASSVAFGPNLAAPPGASALDPLAGTRYLSRSLLPSGERVRTDRAYSPRMRRRLEGNECLRKDA